MLENVHVLRAKVYNSMRKYQVTVCNAQSPFRTVPGLVEHESIPGITTSRPIGMKWFFKSCDRISVTVEMVIKEIDAMVTTLKQNYVDPELVSQIIRQVGECTDCVLLPPPHTHTHTDILRSECHHAQQSTPEERTVSLVQGSANEVCVCARMCLLREYL